MAGRGSERDTMMNAWIHAFRMRTLPLAVSSIIIGSALAYAASKFINVQFKPIIFVLAMVTATLLQVLSNLANDLGDHQHGTDNADRVGPLRAVQSGAISPVAMKRAIYICGALAFFSGVVLITIAFGLTVKTLVFLFIGIAAIAAAVYYTFGSKPYGYAGMGDISVFLFFGIVGVVGTFYLHTSQIHSLILLPACALGLLSVGVLNLNNMRDIVNDAASGKRTLAVRMGIIWSKRYHTALVLVGICALILFTVLLNRSPVQWIFLPMLIIFIVHLKRVWATVEQRALDPQLKVLALGTFFTALTFSLGLLLSA